jgi:DNA-binding NtrC family response regulator
MSTEPLILVVENDSTERDAILRSLSEEHLRVVGAESPDDAMAYMNDSVELVISELHAGDFSGLDLLRMWKSHQPQTPFVLLTDGDDVSSVVEAMKLGAADCIVKPVDPEQLRALVHELRDAPHGNGQVRDMERREDAGSHKSGIDIPPGTSLEDLERAAVEQALAQHHGNRTHAAKTLGISVRTLQRKLKAWGMPVLGMQNQDQAHHFLLPSHSASTSFSAHAH